jgi:hypothetical protein
VQRVSLPTAMPPDTPTPPAPRKRPCQHGERSDPARCSDCLHENRIAGKLPDCFATSDRDARGSPGGQGSSRRRGTRRQTSSRELAQLLRDNALHTLAARADNETALVTHLVRSLYHPDAELRWRAADVLGKASAGWFSSHPARVERLLQRLAWALNDESGTVGWGVPQAIGEIVLHQQAACDRYGSLLASWLGDKEVEVGNELMVHGVIYALGRVAAHHPGSVQSALPHLLEKLRAVDATTRALAACTLGVLGPVAAGDPHGIVVELHALISDAGQVDLYDSGSLRPTTVGATACRAIAAFDR